MKRVNKKIIILLSLIVLAIPVIVKFSYALNNDLRSEEYEIKDNKIYAVPTTYNYRVEELLSKIDSDKELKIYNSNNEELQRGDNVYTGCKLTTDDTTYDIIVLGDVIGDGLIQIGDVASLYNYYRGNKSLSDESIASGKLLGNENISIGDIAKLYNYYKGNKAFSYYNQDMIYVDDVVSKTKNYISSDNKVNNTNIMDKLNINEYSYNNQVIINNNDQIELKISRSNKCYRKEASQKEIVEIDEDLCGADINGFVSNNGALHVSGTKLMNERNEEIRLVGASSTDFGFEEIQRSRKSYNTLKMWGANTTRFFVNANESWVISYSREPEQILEKLDKVIEDVEANDMYLVISWSGVKAQGLTYADLAEDFFTKVAEKYPNDPHLIYEIWNEPESSNTWDQITEYANQLIPSIRAKSPNSIIIVGTPSWDAKLSVVIDNQLPYNNIMYAHHMYMSSFEKNRLTDVENALKAGVPVFVSEWGTETTEKNGKSLVKPLAEAYVSFLDKYNLSHIMFMYGNHNNSNYTHFSIYNGSWNEKLPKENLTDNGLFMRNIISGQRNFETAIMDENSESTGIYYRSEEYKDKIVSIEFKNTINIPDDAVKVWDLSMIQDGKIKGYLENTDVDNEYKLTIAANGEVFATKNAAYSFANLTNLKTIDFTNFSTDYMVSMSSMFSGDSSLQTLDLSTFNTDNLQHMWNTFYGCTNLESINFDNWHPNLTGMGTTFYNCKNLEYLDLRGFNVDKVKSFNNIFMGAEKLKEVNMSTWNPTTVESIKGTFAWCPVLEKIDISNMNITSSTEMENLFYHSNSGIEVKVKNEDVANAINNGYATNNNYIYTLSR